MFVKAKRKVAESRFFLRALQAPHEPDAAEFSFNALLNAGKNVVNAVHAQMLAVEMTRSATEQARATAKAAQESHVKAWKRIVGPVSATLFDVMQEARDIEVHAEGTAITQVANIEERTRRQTVSPDSPSAPIFAALLAIGALSAEVTEYATKYELKVDPTVPVKPRVEALFKQFAQARPRSTTDVASTYVQLLESLVAYCEKSYV
jgi:hypothetical protein